MNQMVPIEKELVSIELARLYGVSTQALIATVSSIAMPKGHTMAELISCLLVAKEHCLNPLTKEIYFMRTKAGSIQPIVGVDGWIRKANDHPQFDGLEFEGDGVSSMTCVIYRKDRKHPIKVTEYLDECRGGGGPVWKSHPKRMLRNRVLCQCARIAFGFAGVMEPEEFEQWQAKDITPARAIPDLPDIPDEAPVQQISPVAKELADQIADQAGFIAMVQSSISACESRKELAEVITSNADVTKRCSPENRQRIAELYREALS